MRHDILRVAVWRFVVVVNRFVYVSFLRIVRFFISHAAEGRSVVCLPSPSSPCSPLRRKVTPSATEARFSLPVLRTVALEVSVLSTFETLIRICRHPIQDVEFFARCFLFWWCRQDAVWSPCMVKYAFLRVSEMRGP